MRGSVCLYRHCEFSLVPDIQPSRPKIHVAPRCGLLQELTRKEVRVLRKPGQVPVHLPSKLRRDLGGDIARIAVLARKYHRVANGIQAVARTLAPEKCRVGRQSDGLAEMKFRVGLQRDQISPGEYFRVAKIRAFFENRVKRAESPARRILITAEGHGAKGKSGL